MFVAGYCFRPFLITLNLSRLEIMALPTLVYASGPPRVAGPLVLLNETYAEALNVNNCRAAL